MQSTDRPPVPPRSQPGGRPRPAGGYGMEEDVQKSRDAGFARHLTKPVTLDVLEDVIDQVRRSISFPKAAFKSP
ncbi:MAG: hypothetical protein WAM82_08865 [Thermoanaerobaculia bacterium]